MSFLQELTDFLKSFMPDKDLPTGEYLLRLMAFTIMNLIFFSLVYYAVIGTVIGNNWGITKTDTQLPVLSHIEFIKNNRQVWGALNQLREGDDIVKGAFTAIFYDFTTGNVLTEDTEQNTQIVLWNFSIPGNSFTSIDTIEAAANTLKPSFYQRFKRVKDCYSAELDGEVYRVLKRGIVNLESNFIAACPIYGKTKKQLNAVVFVLLALPPDIKNVPITKPGTPDNIPRQILLNSYQDRLSRATDSLLNNFSSFDRRYIFYYR